MCMTTRRGLSLLTGLTIDGKHSADLRAQKCDVIRQRLNRAAGFDRNPLSHGGIHAPGGVTPSSVRRTSITTATQPMTPRIMLAGPHPQSYRLMPPCAASRPALINGFMVRSSALGRTDSTVPMRDSSDGSGGPTSAHHRVSPSAGKAQAARTECAQQGS